MPRMSANRADNLLDDAPGRRDGPVHEPGSVGCAIPGKVNGSFVRSGCIEQRLHSIRTDVRLRATGTRLVVPRDAVRGNQPFMEAGMRHLALRNRLLESRAAGIRPSARRSAAQVRPEHPAAPRFRDDLLTDPANRLVGFDGARFAACLPESVIRLEPHSSHRRHANRSVAWSRTSHRCHRGTRRTPPGSSATRLPRAGRGPRGPRASGVREVDAVRDGEVAFHPPVVAQRAFLGGELGRLGRRLTGGEHPK